MTLAPVANHLWQSTAFGIGAWCLSLLLKKNAAAIRYAVWFCASLKFLIPFSLLISAANQIAPRAEIPLASRALSVQLSQPFVADPLPIRLPDAPSVPRDYSAILLAVWLCGSIAVLVHWIHCARKLRAIRRAATSLPLNLPVPVMSVPVRLEPGVFGICDPVLLLPEGIAERLTPPQLKAVLAHEVCHVRRRDNLTGAIHLVVEVIFWFHPLIWYIRTRLVEERERACDEEVLSAADDPQSYAEAILSVCRLYLESPLICASGVTGADLKTRIEKIRANSSTRRLGRMRRVLLIASAVFALVVPVIVGTAQTQTVVPSPQAFEVTVVKPNNTGARNSGFRRFTGGMLNATNITLKMLIAFAYDLPEDQILDGPSWITSDRYDILAKPDRNPDQSVAMIRLRTQALLADRFKLALHKEMRQLSVYALTVDNGGPKHLNPPKGGRQDLINNGHHVTCISASMPFFARVFLTDVLGKPVLDRTGISGEYDFEMEFAPYVNPAAALGGNQDELAVSDPAAGPSIFTAIRQQLGLKLEATKGPVEFLIVAHAEKASEN
jgi:bla regulator protein BlaR1